MQMLHEDDLKWESFYTTCFPVLQAPIEAKFIILTLKMSTFV